MMIESSFRNKLAETDLIEKLCIFVISLPLPNLNNFRSCAPLRTRTFSLAKKTLYWGMWRQFFENEKNEKTKWKIYSCFASRTVVELLSIKILQIVFERWNFAQLFNIKFKNFWLGEANFISPWIPLATEITVFWVSIATEYFFEKIEKSSRPIERARNSDEFWYIIHF